MTRGVERRLCAPQVLQGRDADGQHFRGRTFLGWDGAPITLAVCGNLHTCAEQTSYDKA